VAWSHFRNGQKTSEGDQFAEDRRTCSSPGRRKDKDLKKDGARGKEKKGFYVGGKDTGFKVIGH